MVVASTENQGGVGDPDPEYPAAYEQGVFTVGATTNEDTRSSYSSRGPHIDVVALGGHAVGEGVEEDLIFTTIPNGAYEYTNGTSFAAPMVAGIAALLLSVNPSLLPDDIA